MKLAKSPTPANLVGVGLRSPHIPYILQNHQKIAKEIGWFEVHSENYYALDSAAVAALIKIRKNFPISLHSVGNSLGSAQKLDLKHLKKLKELAKIINPFAISDHISWGMIDKKHTNDLLPLPYNQESLQAISDNISIMQDFLQCQILIENPSAYLAFNNCEMSEAQFINAITKKTGCALLLDVNNIYVSAQNNNQFDPARYLKEINKNIVKEIHLAGHSKSQIFNGKNYQEILIDTHNNLVCNEVWNLYKQAITTFGQISTLIEWDQDIPQFKILVDEAKRAKKILIQEKNDQK